MQINDHVWANDALMCIKTTDPALYADMVNSVWYVQVTDSPDDLTWVEVEYGFNTYFSLSMTLAHAYGVTYTRNNNGDPGETPGLLYHTWLNRPDIESEAHELNVSFAEFLAMILVHEFQHRKDDADELEAFDTDIGFSRKLHSDVLVNFSEETRSVYDI